MTTTLVQDGQAMAYTAPTGGVSSGDLVALTDMVGVAYDDITAGEVGTLNVVGVYTITKVPSAANAFTLGDSVYVTGAGLITNVSTSNTAVGKAWGAATTAATTVPVNLNFGT